MKLDFVVKHYHYRKNYIYKIIKRQSVVNTLQNPKISS